MYNHCHSDNLTVRLWGGSKSSTVVSLLKDTSKNVRYGRLLSTEISTYIAVITE